MNNRHIEQFQQGKKEKIRTKNFILISFINSSNNELRPQQPRAILSCPLHRNLTKQRPFRKVRGKKGL